MKFLTVEPLLFGERDYQSYFILITNSGGKYNFTLIFHRRKQKA
jgi:hypothetical protein